MIESEGHHEMAFAHRDAEDFLEFGYVGVGEGLPVVKGGGAVAGELVEVVFDEGFFVGEAGDDFAEGWEDGHARAAGGLAEGGLGRKGGEVGGILAGGVAGSGGGGEVGWECGQGRADVRLEWGGGGRVGLEDRGGRGRRAGGVCGEVQAERDEGGRGDGGKCELGFPGCARHRNLLLPKLSPRTGARGAYDRELTEP